MRADGPGDGRSGERAASSTGAFDAFEAEGWRRAADGYHRFFAPITSRATAALLDAAGVGPGSRLLDVATGPGYVAAAALSRGAEVTGVDIAEQMVELAGARVPGASFFTADAHELPFADGGFDAAVSSFGLLHMGRPERAMSELARVLAPGGVAAVTVWDDPSRTRLMGLFVDAAARARAPAPPGVPPGPDFFRFADEGELASLLETAGLGEIEIETVAFSHRFATTDELWDGMLAGTVRMRALVESQDEATRRRIRAELETLAAELETPGGGLEVPVSVKLASGRRPSAP